MRLGGQGRGEFLKKGFRVQWRKGRAPRNQSRKQTGDVWCGEAAPSNLLYRASQPCNDYVLAGCDEFDEIARPIEKRLTISTRGGPCKVHRNHAREMSRPLALHEVLIIARGDDMASAQVGFVDPIFVVQDVIFAATTKAAVENVVTAFQGQPHAFANDECARAELLAKHPEAANLRLRCDSPDDPRDGCAVAENVFALTFDGRQSQPVVDDREIVGQNKLLKHRMSCLDA